jgi:phosphomannomutase
MYAVLQEIYARYGYYQTELKSISLPGKDGMEKMQIILDNIRKNPLKEIDGEALTFNDFSQGLYGLPKSDVLRFMSENYRLIIRPSGTEPKMKIYIQVKSANKEELPEMINKAVNLIESLIL